MASISIIRSVLLATGALLIAGCATQPASQPGTELSWADTPLLEKKFQREANNYQKIQHEGQTVYCKRGPTRSMPMNCITEVGLRKQVETFERDRNGVVRGGPQYVATVPGRTGG